jgi:hypothetical protein
MLWGRLWFFVGLNIGKVVEQLNRRGFDTELPEPRNKHLPGFLKISRRVTMTDGRVSRIELPDTEQYASRMLYEFLSVNGFVDMVESATNALVNHVEESVA